MRPDVAAGGLTGLLVATGVFTLDQASKDIAVNEPLLGAPQPRLRVGLCRRFGHALVIDVPVALGVFPFVAYQLVVRLRSLRPPRRWCS